MVEAGTPLTVERLDKKAKTAVVVEVEESPVMPRR